MSTKYLLDSVRINKKTYELMMHCQFSGSNLRKISSFQKKMPTISGDYLFVVGLFLY